VIFLRSPGPRYYTPPPYLALEFFPRFVVRPNQRSMASAHTAPIGPRNGLLENVSADSRWHTDGVFMGDSATWKILEETSEHPSPRPFPSDVLVGVVGDGVAELPLHRTALFFGSGKPEDDQVPTFMFSVVCRCLSKTAPPNRLQPRLLQTRRKTCSRLC